MQKKKWSDLSALGKTVIIVLGIVQVVLLAVTLWDIAWRPAEEIRGDKRIWTGVAFVNWVGPLAYFTIGRKDGLEKLSGWCTSLCPRNHD